VTFQAGFTRWGLRGGRLSGVGTVYQKQIGIGSRLEPYASQFRLKQLGDLLCLRELN
jgi:hypothetical protein